MTSEKLRSVRRLSDLPTMMRTAALRLDVPICTTCSWASAADGSQTVARTASRLASHVRRIAPGRDAVPVRQSRKQVT